MTTKIDEAMSLLLLCL